MNKNLKICIITPDKDMYSETFIKAHITLLPADIRVLYGNGGAFPVMTDQGRPLMELPFPRKLQRIFRKKISQLSEDDLKDEALIQFLIESGVDAVLAEYGPTGSAVNRACRRGGIPLVTHFHGYDAYEYETLELHKKDYAQMFQDAAAFITVSREMRRQLIGLGAPEEKVYYNPCGVDTSVFDGARPEQSAPVFISVGRFVDKKAPHLLILSFEKVLRAFPEAELVMIGNGPLWDSSRQMARALGIEERVKFLGNQPHEQVAGFMRKVRALVQHSIRPDSGDSEGTPVAVMEAGAAGLPVVATRHAGIKDVVIEGETGFLVDERDINGMAEKILMLCRDPRLAGRLGQAARTQVIENFNQTKCFASLVDIISRQIPAKTGTAV